jgi:hypothetical protein
MAVKKMVNFPLLVLCLIILVGCAQAGSQSAEKMINPGDKIGNFLITTGEKEGVTYMTFVHCPLTGQTETCEFPVGTRVNVSDSIYDPDTGNGMTLDEIWSGQTYEMLIEGRPVSLPAFGSIDVIHPVVGKMRNWNVVVVSDKPGRVTIDFTSKVGGDAYKGSFVVIYKDQ